MSTIQVRDLAFSYLKNEPILNGLDLSVEQGSVVGLLGRNGAGKTTLLSLLLGLMRPVSGSVRVFGLDPMTDGLEVKKRIGYVSEDQILPEHLTVTAVIRMFRAIFPDWDDAFVDTLMGRFQLPSNKPIRTMSKGQARQLALLCAVAHKPDLLILDEPGSGVDPVMRRELLETSIDLLSQSGSTILFSSHHVADVERLANRIVVLDNGSVALNSDSDDLKENHCVVTTTANPDAIERLRQMSGCLRTRSNRGMARAVIARSRTEVQTELARTLPEAQAQAVSLEDLFIELVGDSGA